MAVAVARSYIDSDSTQLSDAMIELAREKLIVALDVDSIEAARALVHTLGD